MNKPLSNTINEFYVPYSDRVLDKKYFDELGLYGEPYNHYPPTEYEELDVTVNFMTHEELYESEYEFIFGNN